MKRHHIKWAIIAALAVVFVMAMVLVAKPGAPTFSASPIPTATEQKPSPSIQPNITWSPTSVEVILSPGETTSRTVTFTSSLPLRNVHIKLKKDKEEKDQDKNKEKSKSTSSVKPFLKIEPDRFASVPADRPQTVRLLFAIPTGTVLGTYAGTIALRSNVDESDKDDNSDNDNDGKTLSELKLTLQVQPKITWSVGSIEITLPTEDHTVRNLTFESSMEIHDATLEPVPEIAPFITVHPNTFPVVQSGQAQLVRLFVNIPNGTSLRKYEGNLHLRTSQQTLPNTLKILVNVIPPRAQATINVGPSGGTFALANGITFSVPSEGLTTNVQFDIGYPSASDLGSTIPEVVSVYGAIDIKPSTLDAATEKYSANINLPLKQSLKPGTKLVILEQTLSGDNWGSTGDIATVSSDGKTADFRTSFVGRLIFTRKEERGLENLP